MQLAAVLLVVLLLIVGIQGLLIRKLFKQVVDVRKHSQYVLDLFTRFEKKYDWVILPSDGTMSPHIMLADKTQVDEMIRPLYALMGKLGYEWVTKDNIPRDTSLPKLVKTRKK